MLFTGLITLMLASWLVSIDSRVGGIESALNAESVPVYSALALKYSEILTNAINTFAIPDE